MISKVLKYKSYNVEFGTEKKEFKLILLYKDKMNNENYAIYYYGDNKVYYGFAHIKEDNTLIIMDNQRVKKERIICLLDNFSEIKSSKSIEVFDVDNLEYADVVSSASFEYDTSKVSSLFMKKGFSFKKVKAKTGNGGLIVFIFIFIAVCCYSYYLIKYDGKDDDNVVEIEEKVYDDVVVECKKTLMDEEVGAELEINKVYTFDYDKNFDNLAYTYLYKFDTEEEYNEFKESKYLEYLDEYDGFKEDDESMSFRFIKQIDADDYEEELDYDKVLSELQDDGFNCGDDLEE